MVKSLLFISCSVCQFSSASIPTGTIVKSASEIGNGVKLPSTAYRSVSKGLVVGLSPLSASNNILPFIIDPLTTGLEPTAPVTISATIVVPLAVQSVFHNSTPFAASLVPVSPIYVTFTINPNLPNSGPASGFKMVAGSEQTHNVIGTIPTDAGYSPLWNVKAYDNEAFGSVSNLITAIAAPLLVQVM